jgi:NNP family nitrate/nitrite transporter-like MFS transporter
MLYGYLFANTYGRVMAAGVLLGIAGANSSVGLTLGAGWYPPRHKGFAMGIVGLGNSGTALAALFAPMIAIPFYVITFGCYVGLSVFLTRLYTEQFQFTKIQTTYVLALGALVADCSRMLGGYLADRLGGITMLSMAYIGLTIEFLATSIATLATTSTVLVICCFAAFGCGNGAIFQLVPLRWPSTAAVAGGVIGGVGAMGAAILPLTMGYS